MSFPQKYQFKRLIIDGNRVTIPNDVMKSNDWDVGMEITVTFEPNTKNIKGIVI